MIILRGMDILKNDVQAILGQIFEMKLKENKRFSTMTPGLDKKNTKLLYNLQNFAMKVRLVFQSEITDRTLAESLKIISRLKFFQTLDQRLPRNSF